MASVSGSCVCKKITYTYTGEPTTKAICHCRECQKLTGTAFTYNFLVPRENFKWTSGSPKSNSFVQESGAEIDYHFCPDCATILAKESEADMFKSFYCVPAGTIDGNDIQKKPDVEFWTSRKPEWINPIEGVEQMLQFK
ncbi:hypothetical protein NW754_001536 [Fusarium falciforme]|uniref:CENP-V/GFA domain-containing protein n=1 Tax=Fusarium falciforme TaxID=195108 RepID=A0A9W8QR29_9HYPO|nr:hypothetical protein NW754_001536 [Fusarium falciforme]KAJ4176590.1 hypothetical protein NW755_014337 [Fusarium falciforme]KAJ4176868.1 hypothetical protein NW767_015303 [Fusarium falciforme]KAJ4227330.1 hypothetical protein NW757_014205 [Fusarium falciforme]